MVKGLKWLGAEKVEGNPPITAYTFLEGVGKQEVLTSSLQ